MAEIEATPLEPDSLSSLADAIEQKLLDGDDDALSRSKKKQCLHVVMETFRAIFSGDFAKLESLLTDDAEFTTFGPEEMPMVGRVIGWQAIIKRVIENFSGVTDQRVEVIDAVGQADRISILFHETGRMCATGKTYDIHVTQWFRLLGGRVACIRQVTDTYALCVAKADT
jgi:ketosteroid isomerase-like protein